MSQRTCTLDGCDKTHVARGLCKTHYNQQMPNRHKKKHVSCNACGKSTEKYCGEARYVGTYCSLLCRDYARWGGQSCDLPAHHWARWYGRFSQWTPPLLRNSGTCEWCGALNPRGRTALFCSLACKYRAKAVRRRAREYGAPGTYTWAQVVKLWVAFDERCAYCERPTELSHIEPDHVVALAEGGDLGITNILPACRACNSDKRELSLAAWRTDRIRRGLTPVVTTWVDGDARYCHLTSVRGILAAA